MYYLAGCIFLGVLASLCTWDLSFLLLEVLLDEERDGLEDDDELEDAVLLLGDDVLTEDDERGELDDELDDMLLLLEEDWEELLL